MSRWRVCFWLDDQREDELEVGQIVLELKKKRQFVSTVKAGIRLMTSLRAGETDVLFELFPQLEAQLAKRFTPPTPNSGDLERVINTAVQNSVREAMMNAPGLPATPLVGAPIKPAAAPPKAESKAVPVADANAIADNFLLSCGF